MCRTSESLFLGSGPVRSRKWRKNCNLGFAKGECVTGSERAEAHVESGGFIEQIIVSSEAWVVADPQFIRMKIAQDRGQPPMWSEWA